MKGFIFAAGFGERLYPFTKTIPKPLMPVLNIPSICYSVMLLKKAGITDIICNLHYKYEDIITFFERNNFFNLNIEFSIEEDILGTGGGLKKCEDYFSQDEFIILNSDVIIDIDLNEVIKHHKESLSPATIVLHHTDNAINIGPVGVMDDRIVDFKNYLNTGIQSDYIYSGISVLSPLIFKYLDSEFSSIVYTGYIEMIRSHELKFFKHDSLWKDIGSLESYWNINIELIKDIDIFKNDMLNNLDIKINAISEKSEIDKGAEIFNSVIGENCVVPNGACLKKVVLLPDSSISAGHIKDAVVFGQKVLKI